MHWVAAFCMLPVMISGNPYRLRTRHSQVSLAPLAERPTSPRAVPPPETAAVAQPSIKIRPSRRLGIQLEGKFWFIIPSTYSTNQLDIYIYNMGISSIGWGWVSNWLTCNIHVVLIYNPIPIPLWNTPHGTMVWCGNPPLSHGFWGKKPGCPLDSEGNSMVWSIVMLLFFSGRWLAYVVSFAATMASWAWGGGVGWQNDEGIWGSP